MRVLIDSARAPGDQEAVLFVDDEPAILSALRSALRKSNFRILLATSGQEALGLLETERVAVVVSDFMMPEMNGVELLQEVRRRRPDVQRIMLTGVLDSLAIERAVNEAEVARFLFKPWSDAQLKAVLSECMERVELEASNRRYAAELELLNQKLEAMNRELERQVVERTNALIQAQKMAALGRMAGGIAHEINNPLGGILAFIQVLQRDEGVPGAARETVDLVHECALRCKGVVDSLLCFARRVPATTRARVCLDEVVEQALFLARLHPRAREVEVRVESDGPAPVVLGQAGLLQQVVVNLVNNAQHASRAGQTVCVGLRRDGDQAVLEVSDAGVGIPADRLTNLFEPFYTTKEPGEGTGLGLSICYGIIQEHGGAIDVRSLVGQGTVVTVRLPLAGDGPEEAP
ncbi:MAG TPA: response regulator [Myxococcota bacterium]|nr:response regulator [Myxococcota bacterium]HRY97261.1 response regulator [Myxococcota bacterium]HSA22160.1 response regulator [Myxococcota bacterium]